MAALRALAAALMAALRAVGGFADGHTHPRRLCHLPSALCAPPSAIRHLPSASPPSAIRHLPSASPPSAQPPSAKPPSAQPPRAQRYFTGVTIVTCCVSRSVIDTSDHNRFGRLGSPT